jgi:hypothetical protein
VGRKKKYTTEADKKEAQLEWSKKYYIRNKEVINGKAMKKYYELRKDIQSDNKQS